MEDFRKPALMPMESIMLPAIEQKQQTRKVFAALHTALERWGGLSGDEKAQGGPIDARKQAVQDVRASGERSLSHAAYAHAARNRKKY